MKLFCIHCGKPILTKIGASDREARCLACGKTTLVPGGGPAQERPADSPALEQPRASRSRTKDLVIAGLSLLVVVLL